MRHPEDGRPTRSEVAASARGLDLAVRLGLRLRWPMDAGTGGNSGSDFRALGLEEHLAAPQIADPLCLFDCVPVVAGVSERAPELWRMAGVEASEMDIVSVCDDYPVMALIQLADVGFGDPHPVLAVARGSAARGCCPRRRACRVCATRSCSSADRRHSPSSTSSPGFEDTLEIRRTSVADFAAAHIDLKENG